MPVRGKQLSNNILKNKTYSYVTAILSNSNKKVVV